MALVTATKLKQGTKRLTSFFGDFMAPAIGGIAGFVAPDFLGLSGITSFVIDSTNLIGFLPIIGSLDISGFIASAIYAGVAVALFKFRTKGTAIGGLMNGLIWYFGASAFRLALDALVNSLRTVRTVAQVGA